MLKRMIALLLVFALAFSNIYLPLSATEGTTDTEPSTVEEEVVDENLEEGTVEPESEPAIDVIAEESSELPIDFSIDPQAEMMPLANDVVTPYAAFPCFAGTKAVNQVFPDPSLASLMATFLGLTTTSQVDCATLNAKTGTPSLNGNSILSLEGLQYMTSVGGINLIGQAQYTDITPLTYLTQLVTLNLYGAKITNLNGLEVLDNLTVLNISSSKVNNLTAIQGMAKISVLNLTGVVLGDTVMNQLANITTLTQIYAGATSITKLNAFSNLTNLTYLNVANNSIIDLAPISGLVNLNNLQASNNQITNIAPLNSLTNLATLNISNNYVYNLSSLTNLSATVITATGQTVTGSAASLTDTGQGAIPLTKTNFVYNRNNSLVPPATISSGGTYAAPTISWADVGSTKSFNITWNETSGNVTFSGTITYAVQVTETLTENYVTRKSVSIRTSTSKNVIRPDAYSKTAPVITNYVYLGYNLDGGTMLTGFPSIASVTSNRTVNMIYGVDNNNNGVEDTFVITEKYEDRLGNSVLSDTSKTINAMTDYSGSSLPYSGYVYVGYTLDGGAIQTGNPSIINVSSNHTIVMIYGVDSNDDGIEDTYAITEEYQDRFGGAIPGLSQTSQTIYSGLPYSLSPPTASGYTYVGYQVDGGSTQTGDPALPFISSVYTMTLIYRLNGDFTITENYIDRLGNVLNGSTSQIIANTDPYSGTPETISGHVYLGFKVNGGTLTTGNPAIASVTANETIDLIYGIDGNNDGVEDTFAVNETYVNRTDTTIKTATSQTIIGLLAYSLTPPAITNYVYLGYYLDGSTTLTKSNPAITSVTSTHSIKLLYGVDNNNDGVEDVDVMDEYYVDRLGNTISTATQQTVDDLTDYSATPKSITNYIYVGYTIDSGTMQTGNPSIISVNDDHIITMIYGINNNNDGIEDIYTVTEKYHDRLGATIQADTSQSITALLDYSKIPSAITNYAYLGFKVDDGALMTGYPSIASVTPDMTVTLIYGVDNNNDGIEDTYMVTEVYQNRLGDSINVNSSQTITALVDYGKMPPILTNYTYLGYKIDGGTLTTGNPSIASVTSDVTVTLIYGIDNNNDGIEDTYTVTEQFISTLNDVLQADVTHSVTALLNFDSSHPSITHYQYNGYRIDGGTFTQGSPSLASVTNNTVITYIYDPVPTYVATIHLVNRLNQDLEASTTATYYQGEYYTATPKTINDYMYLGWRVDNSQLLLGIPSIAMNSDHNIYHVYGIDNNNDGTEDTYTVTEKYQDRLGTMIQADTSKTIVALLSYSKTASSITNYAYIGYTVNNGLMQTGNPSISSVMANDTVIMIYGVDGNNDGVEDVYTITEKYQDRLGTQINFDSSTSIAATLGYSKIAPLIHDYLYLGYKVDGGAIQTGNPTITSVTADTTITLVYGADNNNDGIEDTYTVTEKYQDRLGNSVQSNTSQTITALLGYSHIAPTITNYVYLGYKVDSGIMQTGNPIITSVTADTMITLVYGVDNNNDGIEDTYTITEKYQDRLGSTVLVDTTQTITALLDYSNSAPTISDYIYLGYKINGGSMMTGNPSIISATADTTITLVYGVDNNNDGIEDTYTITEKHQDRLGATLDVDTTQTITGLLAYSKIPLIITNYVYLGYTINGGSMLIGMPSIASVTSDNTIVLIYGVDNNNDGTEDTYTVTEKYQDRLGTALQTDTSQTVTALLAYSKTAPSISNYVYLGYKINSGTMQTGNPTITSVTANTAITLVYGIDNNNDGTEDTYTITENYINRLGDSVDVSSSQSIIALMGYSKTPQSLPNYVYVGYYLDSSTILIKSSPSITSVDANHTITLLYGIDNNNDGVEDVNVIDENYVDRLGNEISASTSQTIDDLNDYSKTPILISNYVYVGYKVDNGPLLTGNPSIADVIEPHIVDLVYGVDNNNDGIEDTFIITEKYENRLGTSLEPDTSQTIIALLSYNKTPQSISNFVYIGFKLDGGTLQTGNPSITSVTTDATVVLVYGVDNNNDGTEDTFTITEKYENRLGTSVQTDTAQTIIALLPYSKIAPSITNYVYLGYEVDGGTLQTGSPSISSVIADATITFVYGVDNNNDGIEDTYTVSELYQNRAGDTVDVTSSQAITALLGYSKIPPTITNYVYVGYIVNPLARAGIQTGNPSIASVTANTTVILVYGVDNNNDGIEDTFTMTESYLNLNNVLLEPDIKTTVDALTTFNGTVKTYTSYEYLGYSIDNGEMVSGTPSLSRIMDNHLITYYYHYLGDHNINEKFITRDGQPLYQEVTKTASDLSQFQDIPLVISGYEYMGYKVDGNQLQLGNPLLSNIMKDYTIEFVYHEKSNNEVINPDVGWLLSAANIQMTIQDFVNYRLTSQLNAQMTTYGLPKLYDYISNQYINVLNWQVSIENVDGIQSATTTFATFTYTDSTTNHSISIKVQVVLTGTLPSTGQSNLIIWLSGISFVLIGCFMIFIKKRRQEV